MPTSSLIPFFIAFTVLLALLVLFIVSFLIIQKQKQNAYQADKERMLFDHQNKLLLARIEEQERTMDEISREIHDHIGQMLSFAKMNMFSISAHATVAAQKETIETVQSLLAQLMIDVQNISHNLNGEFIRKRGLITIIDDELKYINAPGRFLCSMVVNGDAVSFEPQSELLIYRIAQEAMHNATKHSRASALTVTLTYDGDIFAMEIADNGVGFQADSLSEMKGIGFLNMVQRANLLNGTFAIDAAPGNGCRIMFSTSYQNLLRSLPIAASDIKE